jgi:hypothetical protein
LVHSNVKPWFHVSIVMNDSSVADLIHANTWIISETKHMPGFVQ